MLPWKVRSSTFTFRWSVRDAIVINQMVKLGNCSHVLRPTPPLPYLGNVWKVVIRDILNLILCERCWEVILEQDHAGVFFVLQRVRWNIWSSLRCVIYDQFNFPYESHHPGNLAKVSVDWGEIVFGIWGSFVWVCNFFFFLTLYFLSQWVYGNPNHYTEHSRHTITTSLYYFTICRLMQLVARDICRRHAKGYCSPTRRSLSLMV